MSSFNFNKQNLNVHGTLTNPHNCTTSIYKLRRRFFCLSRPQRRGIVKSAWKQPWTFLRISRGVFWAELWGLVRGPLLEYMMVEPGQDMLHRHTTLTKIFSHLVAKHTNRCGIVHWWWVGDLRQVLISSSGDMSTTTFLFCPVKNLCCH